MSHLGASLWVRNVSKSNIPSFPPLSGHAGFFDIAVIGGGLFGMSAAMRLAEQGLSVVVLEARRIGTGISSNTTAKLSSLHNIVYTQLVKTFGVEGARAYAEFNEAGINLIEENIKRYGIECEFQRVSNCTYALEYESIARLRKEAKAARKAGLPVDLIEETPPDMPFKVAANLELPNQARFNSYKYCIGMAEALMREYGGNNNSDTESPPSPASVGPSSSATFPPKRCNIFEESRVESMGGLYVKPPFRLTTSGGSIDAERVVVATHMPIFDRGLHAAFTSPVVSYCLAFAVKEEYSGRLLQHMYINPEEPSLSLRPAEDADGRPVIVAAGSGHPMGSPPLGNTEAQYLQLEEHCRAMIPYLGERLARWSGEDYSPADGAPYVGYLHRASHNLFTATGFAKWGLAAAAGSAIVVSGLITKTSGRHDEWARVLDARRWDLLSSAGELAKAQMKVCSHFVGDRVKDLFVGDIEDLAPDSGGIVRMPRHLARAREAAEGEAGGEERRERKGIRIGGKRVVGGYRDADNGLHAVNLVCTHLGCHVRWNQGDRTWDCPCHGSRFTVDGDVVHGPAVKSLKRYL